jgi:signal transduction histidine kinase
VFLFYLVRRGFLRTAAYLLVITYAIPALYSLFTWGTDLPAGLLLIILIITLSGILLGANLILINTGLLIVFLLTVTYFQGNGIIKVASYWRQDPNEVTDVVAYSFMLLISALITWLFCLTTRKALQRAIKSEAELKEERDSLETKVIERSAQIKLMEMEKISQLYRLAEFGRLSSGIFHDLVNPLTAVSLNLEQVRIEGEQKLLSAKSFLNQAILATRKMEDLIISIKKQIQKEGTLLEFSINEEIKQIIEILAYKSRKTKVTVNFFENEEFKLYGDPIKFGQVMSNLLANAIEACENDNEEALDNNCKTTAKIDISLKQNAADINIEVSDSGSGITPENISRIFEPFFSTKIKQGRGLGIGLASTKNIIEKDFKGTIKVESEINNGAKFKITLPYEKK